MLGRALMVCAFAMKAGVENTALSVFALVAVGMVNVFRIRTLRTVHVKPVGPGPRVSFCPVLHPVWRTKEFA